MVWFLRAGGGTNHRGKAPSDGGRDRGRKRRKTTKKERKKKEGDEMVQDVPYV